MRKVRKGREGQNDTNTVLMNEFIYKTFKTKFKKSLVQKWKTKTNVLCALETQGDRGVSTTENTIE